MMRGPPVFEVASLFVAALLSTIPALPPTPVPSPGLAELFSARDYPPAALQQHEEGKVGVLVRVDSNGAVRDCIVEASSGFGDLDNRTCEIIRTRARFRPAKDASGHPAASELHQKIAWRIAEEAAPSKPWATRTVMDYSPEGNAVSCRIEHAGALASPSGIVPQCPPQAYERHAPRVAGFDMVTRTIAEQRFEPGPGSPPVPEQGDVLVGRKVLALVVDAAGKLTSCSTLSESGIGGPADACARIPKLYQPVFGRDGKTAAFSATLSLNLYVHVDPGN